MRHLYGLHDPIRTRAQIIADHAAAHDLSVRQVRALVEQLPDCVPERPGNVVRLADRRAS